MPCCRDALPLVVLSREAVSAASAEPARRHVAFRLPELLSGARAPRRVCFASGIELALCIASVGNWAALHKLRSGRLHAGVCAFFLLSPHPCRATHCRQGQRRASQPLH